MDPEDKALLLGAIAAGVGGAGTFLTGDPTYGTLGGLLLAIAAALKALIPGK